MDSLDRQLDEIQVVYRHQLEPSVAGYAEFDFYVVDGDGTLAGFNCERRAFRYRLAEINLRINPIEPHGARAPKNGNGGADQKPPEEETPNGN